MSNIQKKERTPQTPPIIYPINEGVMRPLFSVAIPVYNCYDYIKLSLQSVLQQDLGPNKMEIYVVDDGSTDGNVEELIKNIGGDRVGYYRQPTNVGSLRNFETAINISKGYYIHILHGDDEVKNGFYKEIEQLFDENPTAGAAFTEFEYIDNVGIRLWDNEKVHSIRGIIENWANMIASKQLLQVPAMVVKRSTYEKLGSFYAVHYGEDWEMWVRIAINYPVAYSPQYLARYRVHRTNISSRSLKSGQNLKDIKKVIGIIYKNMPADIRKKINKQCRKNFAEYYARIAHRLYHEHNDYRSALIQANGSLRLYISKVTLKNSVKLYLKVLIGYGTIKNLLSKKK